MRKVFLISCMLVVAGFIHAQVPRLIADIDPQTRYIYSNPRNFINTSNSVFFNAWDGLHNPGLWQSDGASQTHLVVDMLSTNGAHIALGNKVVFGAGDGIIGAELYITDGYNTTLLKDIDPAGSSNPQNMYLVDNKIFFLARTVAEGLEWWVTDGTPAGTRLLKDINPGVGDAVMAYSPSYSWQNRFYFSASDDTHGLELWVSDGSTAGTHMVKDIMSYGQGLVGGSHPNQFIAYNNRLYFIAEDSLHGMELWSTDGTEANTGMVKDINPQGASFLYLFDCFEVLNNKLYFSADDGIHGTELWSTDGTEAGTKMVKDIYSGSIPSSPSHSVRYNGRIYFVANDSIHGAELWATDGTESGTVMIKDIHPGTASTLVSSSKIVYNGKLYFTADGTANGFQLWETDGSDAGTRPIVPPVINSSSSLELENNFAIANNTLFFGADYEHATIGMELYGLTTSPNSVTRPTTKLQSDIHVYPNPATDFLQMATPYEGTVTIYDALGKKINRQKTAVPLTLINLADYLPGTYMVLMNYNNGQRNSARFSKQ